MTKWKSIKPTSSFRADIVWGCAVAVDDINKGYCKTIEYTQDHVIDEPRVSRNTNKSIVKTMLAEHDFADVTEEHIEKGKELRHYFNGWLLKEVAGTINEFEQGALRIAQMDYFTNRNLLEFSIISCLPATRRRTIERDDLKKQVRESTPLIGEEGDLLSGELIIVNSYYNTNYDKFHIKGRFGEAFVDFWFKQGFDIDAEVQIKGRIKQHRSDNSTQLNYVRLI